MVVGYNHFRKPLYSFSPWVTGILWRNHKFDLAVLWNFKDIPRSDLVVNPISKFSIYFGKSWSTATNH